MAKDQQTKEIKAEETAKPIRSVYEAIAAVQGELAKEGIGKDNYNDQQKYKFRGIDDVYNALASLLAKSGLCILPRVLSRTVTERVNKNGTALFYVVVDVEYDLVLASMPESRHTVKVCGEAMDSGDKATNKAMSAAYKYACLQTFCIPTEGDNDADKTTHEVKGKQVGVFDSAEAREQYAANCIDAIRKADSIERLKDLRDLEAARREAMKSSPAAEDRDAYNRIVAAQSEMAAKLKPVTVDAAKQAAPLPADVAADPIPL